MSNPFKATSLSLAGTSVTEKNNLKDTGQAVDGQIIYVDTTDGTTPLDTPRYEYFHAASNEWYELGSGPVPDSTFVSLTDPSGNYYPIPYTVGGLSSTTNPADLDGQPVNSILQTILYPEVLATYTNGTYTLSAQYAVVTNNTQSAWFNIGSNEWLEYGTNVRIKWTTTVDLGHWNASYAMFDNNNTLIDPTTLDYWGVESSPTTTITNFAGFSGIIPGNTFDGTSTLENTTKTFGFDMTDTSLSAPIIDTLKIRASSSFADGDIPYTSRKKQQTQANGFAANQSQFLAAAKLSAYETINVYKPFFANQDTVNGPLQDLATPQAADSVIVQNETFLELEYLWQEGAGTTRMGFAIPSSYVKGAGVQIFGWDDNNGVYFSANSNSQWSINTEVGFWTAADGSTHDYVVVTSNPAQGDNTNLKIKVTWS